MNYERNSPIITREVVLSGISIAIFDLDGTISLDLRNPGNTNFRDSLQYEHLEANAINLIASRSGKPRKMIIEEVKRVKEERKSLRKYIGETYQLPSEDYFKIVWDIHPEGLIISRPYALELIEQLKEEQKTLMLLTKAPTIWQQRVFAYFNIQGFTRIYTGDISDNKAMVFASLAKEFSPATCLSIGDSVEHDILPALHENIRVYWVNRTDDLKILVHS